MSNPSQPRTLFLQILGCFGGAKHEKKFEKNLYNSLLKAKGIHE